MEENLYENFSEIQKDHWWFVAKKKIILSLVKLYSRDTKNQKILDAGCGAGLMLNDLSRFGIVSGMDFSPEAILVSKKIFAGELRQGELPDNLPYDSNSFDLILALDVVEHIERDTDSIRTLKTRLKKGGIGILTVPAYMFLWSKHDDINHHKRRYTLTEFEEKIKMSGLKIEKITYFNTLLFLPILMVRLKNKILGIDNDPDVKMPGKLLNRILKTIFSFEDTLLKFISFPFGVSVLAIVTRVDD